MKVLLVGTSLQMAYGGPAVSVSNLGAALADHGADVGVWAPDRSAPRVADRHPSSGVLALTGTLAEALAEFGAPDVLHDNGIWLPHNHRLALWAGHKGVPRVVSARGMLEPWAFRHKRWKKAVAWMAYQRRDLAGAQLLHATSKVEGENLRRRGLGVPVEVIRNGVDVPPEAPRRRPEGARTRTALFLGRIYPVKGLPNLLEAWTQVRPPGWRLRIVGPEEGGHQARLERQVRDAGLSQVVTFSGPVDGTAKRCVFREADLFVLPSHSESFGMAVGEALAHGVPVLTTTAVPWSQLETRGCGWRAPPTVEGLATILRIATAKSPAELWAMGNRGRRLIATEFGWSRVAAAFLDIYGELVRARRAISRNR